MKKLFIFLVGAVVALSLTSCVTAAQAQVDDVYGENNSVEVSVIITEGTPAYDINGYVVYYFYDGWYYYPYIYNNRYHFRRYITPVNTYYIRGWHRPIPKPHIRHHRPAPRPDAGSHKPHHGGTIHHNNPRPGGNHNGGMRPNTNPRPSGNRPSMGHGSRPSSTRSTGYFGGRR